MHIFIDESGTFTQGERAVTCRSPGMLAELKILVSAVQSRPSRLRGARRSSWRIAVALPAARRS